MAKVIQMVPVSKELSLFISDFDGEVLSFRTSRNPAQNQKEKIVFKGNMVYTSLYHFHRNFLTAFK
jgi:hypothetical protein